MNELTRKIWIDYCNLSGRMAGTLLGISHCDIPDNLREKILADREAIKQDYLEKKEKYENHIYE